MHSKKTVAIRVRPALPGDAEGLREVGCYREQGKLDGRWVDVLIMEKLLGQP